MLKELWIKIKNLDFYRKALLISVPITGALLAYLLSIGAADLIFSNWFINLISVPTFVANQLASAAYFGRITDLFNKFKQTIKENKSELIFTLTGMLTGITIGIGLAIMHVAIPLTASLAGFASVLFTLRQMNIFAGLGNRIGRSIDKNSRPLSEKVIILSTGLIGLTLGIVLFSTLTAAMISVVGVTSFFTGGAAIPAWIAGIIFILSLSSGVASSADYVSKGISFIRSYFIPKETAENDLQKEGTVTYTVTRRKYEYGGSLVGVTIGLVVGAVIVGAIVATNPFLLTGVVGAIAGILIIATCVGMIGSIGSRIGRFGDPINPSNPPNDKDIGEQQRIVHDALNRINSADEPKLIVGQASTEPKKQAEFSFKTVFSGITKFVRQFAPGSKKEDEILLLEKKKYN